MLARAAYALLFTLLIPLGLSAWAFTLDTIITLPRVHHPGIGAAVLISGLSLIAWSVIELYRRGAGLPMNAFPTSRLIETGPYRLLTNPIYVGFGAACIGTSVLIGSPAGFWLASPIAIAGCAALVIGYERDATKARLGLRARPPLISLPNAGSPQNHPPSAWERASVYLLVFLPWLIVYEAVGHLPVPDAINVMHPVERGWPVLVWAEPLYANTYALACLAPLVVPTRGSLRDFALTGIVGTAIGILCYLVIPFVAPPRPIGATGLLADMLALERADGLSGRAAFPSFHVFWAVVAASVWSARWPRAKWLIRLWCAGTIAACSATGMHAVVDLAAGVALAIFSMNWRILLRALARGCEFVANSWREWRVGPIRVISHGFIAGAAAAVGIGVTGTLVGPERAAWIALVAVLALIGAGLWGKALVGPRSSQRPFGYYGCVIGAGVGLAVAGALGRVGWNEAAALCVAAPWVQAIGRCRCLVQGCCHGGPTDAWWAIRYVHPRSRVCRVADLAGTPVHPTPMYSMLGNIVIGVLLARLWFVGAPPGFIAGMYLALAGLARFVEEHFRGEVTTKTVRGLHTYQWFAIVSVVAGMALAVLETGAGGANSPGAWQPNWATALWAGVIGIVYFAAMGVDFPDADWPFARLT